MSRLLVFLTGEYLKKNDYVGGAVRRLESIAPQLERLGTRLEIIAFAEDKQGARFSPVVLVPRRGRMLTLRLILAGIGAVRVFDCDGIYAWHSDFAGVIIPSYIVSKITRKSLFVVVHDPGMKESDSPNLVRLCWRDLRRRPSGFKFHYLIRRQAIRNASACICVSSVALNYAKSLGPRNPKLSSNGVASAWFNLPDSPKKFDAIFVGRPQAAKGVFGLIQAWQRVVSRFPMAQLLIVGPVTSGERRRLQEMIDRLALGENVTIKGVVSDSELKSLVSSSRLFVLPSLGEGFGLAAAEAMAAGVPCVLSDIPAFRENFGAAVLLVPPTDTEALADRMIRLIENPEEARELGRAGRRLAIDMRWENVAALESKIIEESTKLRT